MFEGSAFIWFVQMFFAILSEIPDFVVWDMSEIPDFWVLQDYKVICGLGDHYRRSVGRTSVGFRWLSINVSL